VALLSICHEPLSKVNVQCSEVGELMRLDERFFLIPDFVH
jgi:hypothetical protein